MSARLAAFGYSKPSDSAATNFNTPYALLVLAEDGYSVPSPAEFGSHEPNT